MSPIEFRDAERAATQLLVLIAGGSGSGKTESALRLATGLAAGGTIAAIDTERGRMLHKADDYTFKHAELDAPFTPERYAEAIEQAETLNPAVLVIDSGSHVYDGEGGYLDIQLAEFARLGGGENVRLLSWAEPARRHKIYVRALLRARPHLIVCHRAEDKVEMVKDDRGKTVIQAKQSLAGAGGWIPICHRRLPFEATLSVVLVPDNPGVPIPVKLERRHADLIRTDSQLDEDTGRRLAEWAAGAQTGAARLPSGSTPGSEARVDDVLALARSIGDDELAQTENAIATRRGKNQLDAEWLDRLEISLRALQPPPAAQAGEGQSSFANMIPDSERTGGAYGGETT